MEILKNHNQKYSHNLFYSFISTPLGEMIACDIDESICLLEFLDTKNLDKELEDISKYFKANFKNIETEVLRQLKTELIEYFEKKRKFFSLPITLVGTDFQKSVWEILQQIPYGATKTYSEQSEILANPKAIRAVASANGKNKIAIIIPCHRVIGKNGTLTGYAGGIWRKQKLLELENAILL